MDQDQTKDEPIVVYSEGFPEKRKKATRAVSLLVECMCVNNIDCSSGVSACVSIALTGLSQAGASNGTVNKILRLLEEAQQEVYKKQPEVRP